MNDTIIMAAGWVGGVALTITLIYGVWRFSTRNTRELKRLNKQVRELNEKVPSEPGK